MLENVQFQRSFFFNFLGA